MSDLKLIHKASDEVIIAKDGKNKPYLGYRVSNMGAYVCAPLSLEDAMSMYKKDKDTREFFKEQDINYVALLDNKGTIFYMKERFDSWLHKYFVPDGKYLSADLVIYAAQSHKAVLAASSTEMVLVQVTFWDGKQHCVEIHPAHESLTDSIKAHKTEIKENPVCDKTLADNPGLGDYIKETAIQGREEVCRMLQEIGKTNPGIKHVTVYMK